MYLQRSGCSCSRITSSDRIAAFEYKCRRYGYGTSPPRETTRPAEIAPAVQGHPKKSYETRRDAQQRARLTAHRHQPPTSTGEPGCTAAHACVTVHGHACDDLYDRTPSRESSVPDSFATRGVNLSSSASSGLADWIRHTPCFFVLLDF